MNKIYDLTTKAGRENSLSYIKSNPDLVLNPIGHFITKGITSALKSGEKVEEQVAIASKIIEKGKKDGVKYMKIKVSEKAGLDIQSTMKEYPIKCTLGSKGNMEIEVEYK